jgi:hypothetical protein
MRAISDVRSAPDSDRESGLQQTAMSALPPRADMCGATSDVGSRRQTNTATRGKITLISVNSPGCVSTSIEPPCCLTMMS